MFEEGERMRVELDVPDEMAQQFATQPGGIARAAAEGLAAEGVRSGKLTVYQARQLLGIRSRYEMDGFLKAHGVLLPISMEQVFADGDTAIKFAKSWLSSPTPRLSTNYH